MRTDWTRRLRCCILSQRGWFSSPFLLCRVILLVKNSFGPINHKSWISFLSERTERCINGTDIRGGEHQGRTLGYKFPCECLMPFSSKAFIITFVLPLCRPTFSFYMWAVLLPSQTPAGMWECVCECVLPDACWGFSQWFVCLAEWVCCPSLKQPRRKRTVHQEPLCGFAELTSPPPSLSLSLSAVDNISSFIYRRLIDALMQSNSLKRNSRAKIFDESPGKQGRAKTNHFLLFLPYKATRAQRKAL